MPKITDSFKIWITAMHYKHAVYSEQDRY